MDKKYLSILPGVLLIISVVLMSSKVTLSDDAIPADVEKILDRSCYGCHTTGAKAEDAVKAVDFKKWEELKPTKKVGALNEIKEVIEKDAMPPEKIIKKYPEMALSEDDKEMILKWVSEETAKLMK